MLQTDLAGEISPLRASKRRDTDSHGSGRFRTLMPDSQLLLDLVEYLRDAFRIHSKTNQLPRIKGSIDDMSRYPAGQL